MQYILNKNAQTGTGYHKIHKKNCPKLPKKENQIELKDCVCSLVAKDRAKEYYATVNGCQYCCKEIYYEQNKGA